MTAVPPWPPDADAGDVAAGQSAIVPSTAEPMIMLKRPPRMPFPLPIKPPCGESGCSYLIVRIASGRRPPHRPPREMIRGKSEANRDPAIGMDR
ncbi:hypothetical protein [Microbispora sp. GKU 823]|uniref:hypothetical protein n=1 Tax=Microbispora sp. GKU 823 TaxID=1652100 RepID=UPI00117E5DF9|nr:hypothetical protein [Microbispora sp. GKU 823]